MDDELKGNSNASKVEQRRVIKPVTTNVTVRTEGQEKSKPKFFSEDAKSVGGHVLTSVIVPSLQKLLSDTVKGAIDWLIYGSRGTRSNAGPGVVQYTSYNRSYTNPNITPYSNPMMQKRPSNVYSVNEVIFNDRGEAEEVLLRMMEAIETYSMVSVLDFYDLTGQKSYPTDQKYGWYDLRTADVISTGNGYVIRFPRVQPLE